jgi:hypothetical protein
MSPANNRAIESLCPTCNLCCNGVLFADVELQIGDDPERLKPHGIKLRRKGRKKCFSQPCVALQDDGMCSAYKDRPGMCRDFECGLLLRVAGGDLSVQGATKRIRKAQRLVRKVRQLLELLGNHNVELALTKRYQAVMMEPIDMAGDEELVDARGELMLTVQELMDLASREFLARPE